MSRPDSLARHRSKTVESQKIQKTAGAIYVCPMFLRLVWSAFDGTTAPNKLLHNMNIIAGEERLCSTYYLVLKLPGWVIPI